MGVVAFLSFFSGGVARQRGRAKEGGRAEVERVFAHGKGVGKEKRRKFKTKVGK